MFVISHFGPFTEVPSPVPGHKGTGKASLCMGHALYYGTQLRGQGEETKRSVFRVGGAAGQPCR